MNELRDIRALESYHRYVLNEIRNARKRAALLVSEIDNILFALDHRVITPNRALCDLARAHALEFLQPAPPQDQADAAE